MSGKRSAFAVKQMNPDHRSDQKCERVSVVYFGAVSDDRIKIGFTTDLPKRMRDHAKDKLGTEVDFAPLCAVRGTRADEKAVQRYFKSHVLDGQTEVFRPHEDVVDYIRWLRDQYFVWVPDDTQCDDIGDHDAVDQALWMPKPERRKVGPRQKSLLNEFGPFNLPPRELTVDDFYTDSSIIEAARTTLGGIDLDPSSHPIANRVVKASRFFTLHDDGLSKRWAGRVWLNPPFSHWQEWVPKIISEWNSGDIDAMCVLCATRTLTAQYFAPIHRECQAVCILRGRIPFWGGRAATPDDGHAIFYFGGNIQRFYDSFSLLGTVYLQGGFQ